VSDEVNAEVNKGGERKVTVAFLRTAQGTFCTVRALSEIEDFFRSQANESIDVHEFGHGWVKKDQDLKVWLTANDPGEVLAPGFVYTITPVAASLVSTNRKGQKVVNLSLLRLVGISEPAGVTFKLSGAYTLPLLQEMSQNIVQAARQFYVDFFKPIYIEVGIVTSQMRL
jgi:hypothetical protein